MTSKYTPERILEAIQKIYAAEQPGMKIPGPALGSYILDELLTDGYTSEEYQSVSKAISDYFAWMIRNPDTAPLLSTKGRLGGWTLRDIQPTSNQTEKPCFSCSRMNDLGVSKCWWCEAESPTKETV